METRRKGVPVGAESFEEVITEGLYYVDKTGLIADLLKRWSKVTLITRPRRFGKTLNMSMLKSFFSIEGDKRIFDGMAISGERELCEEHMGQYPVLALSLKSINAGNYEDACEMAVDIINETAMEVYRQVEGSSRLLPLDRERLNELMQLKIEQNALFGSLYAMTDILRKHYGKKVILLIDEYDVPLAKAWEQGYYDQMVRLLRNMFEKALKTNDNLKMAVLTGCMRISKESIFTGLNNLRVLGISDRRLDEYFGFTDAEVRNMLEYCGAQDQYEAVRDWYDGYRFGDVNVYCPWDVINYCDQFLDDPTVKPQSYWLNSSGNSIVRKLIGYSGSDTVRGELERLVNGEPVEKNIREDLTYPEMYASIDNIWSVLYTTGYLTQTGKRDGNRVELRIPNLEIRAIFAEQIIAMFEESVHKDGESMGRLCDAVQEGNVPRIEESLNEYLRMTISIRDTAVRKTLKENFYHGLLVGILSARDTWRVESNRESGSGYCDILVRGRDGRFAMVIEVKYAEEESLGAACSNALKQSKDREYADILRREGYDRILTYGIAFHLKDCRVVLER